MDEPLPLAGIKVADFSWVIAGPMSTRYLAVYGAQVVKIESHARLDSARIGPPFIGKPSRNSSAMFGDMNPSKMSLSLNFNVPEAREIARRMAGWADIAVENFSVGQMSEWGLDYENLKQVNPGLIMLSSSQQGQYGPHAHHPGLGNLLQGLAGISHLTGWPDRAPRAPKIPMPDTIAPTFTVMALLAAMEYRDRTGRGQYLDLSQMEATLQYLAPSLLDFTVNDRDGSRHGNDSDEAAPHNAYRCYGENRWCAISVRTGEEWQGLLRVIGEPSWNADPRFQTLEGRREHLPEIDDRINEWTEQRPAEEVMKAMQEAGVPAGLVADGRDFHEDPQLAFREHFKVLEHPGRGTLSYRSPAFRISGIEPEFRRASTLGEHNEKVCRDLLGMPEAEYKGLVDAGAFE